MSVHFAAPTFQAGWVRRQQVRYFNKPDGLLNAEKAIVSPYLRELGRRMSPQSLHLRLVGGRGDTGQPLHTIDPIAVLEVDHLLKMELCDVLEGLADGLPHEAKKSEAEVAVTVLRNGLPDHIALEEQHLFPLLHKRNGHDPRFQLVLAHLKHEHDNDGAFAFEIAEELERLIGDGTARNAEMLGYMLRGFFVAIRRHVRWENATVLPLARETLTTSDLDELREAIIDRARRHAG